MKIEELNTPGWAVAALLVENQQSIEKLKAELAGAEDRQRLLLDAKDHWAERARAAESKLSAALKEIEQWRDHAAERAGVLELETARAEKWHTAQNAAADECAALQSRLHSCELQRDEWKKYADNGLSSYAELQAEVARLSSRLDQLQKAVSSVVMGEHYDFHGKAALEDALSASLVERHEPK